MGLRKMKLGFPLKRANFSCNFPVKQGNWADTASVIVVTATSDEPPL